MSPSRQWIMPPKSGEGRPPPIPHSDRSRSLGGVPPRSDAQLVRARSADNVDSPQSKRKLNFMDRCVNKVRSLIRK